MNRGTIITVLLIIANMYVYHTLYRKAKHIQKIAIITENTTKKDCSKCKWKLRKECSVIEGICEGNDEYNNDIQMCKINGYKFLPSGVISKLNSKRCDDAFANACFDENNEICNKEICSEESWVPKGCTPYKEVGVCLDDITANNNPQKCSGTYLVNGIIKK